MVDQSSNSFSECFAILSEAKNLAGADTGAGPGNADSPLPSE